MEFVLWLLCIAIAVALAGAGLSTVVLACASFQFVFSVAWILFGPDGYARRRRSAIPQ